jgi:hypothetical protein
MDRIIVAAWTGVGLAVVGGLGGVGGLGASSTAWAQPPSQPAAPAAASPAAAKPQQPADPSANPAAPAPVDLDWKLLESPLLLNHRQITQREHNMKGPGFLKAGEAYFDHHQPPKYIIFQATVVPPQGVEPDPFYAMYVARLLRESEKSTVFAALDEPIRISAEKSANTCGWFHPTIPWRVLFGSTLTAPAEEKAAGFQVGTRKYVWMFPKEMEVVTRDLRPVHRELTDPTATTPPAVPAGFEGAITKVIERPNYDAECSWSKDGRFVLYAHVRDEPTHGRPDADIWVYDTKTNKSHELVKGEGYDGGPFFSPDGKMICYRSDRRGDDLLQLFVAVLKFDADGVPVGIESEHQITDDQHVNWAPYWHPSGKFLVYGSSGVAHSNYEIFAVEVDLKKSATELRKRRVTFASGADVLPVFSDDGKYMMWTAQRGPMVAGETKPSSQLWIAEVNTAPGGFTDPEHLFDNLPDQRPEGQPAAAPAAHPTNK